MIAAVTKLNQSVEKLRHAVEEKDITVIRKTHADVRQQYTALRSNLDWTTNESYSEQLRHLVKLLSRADRMLADKRSEPQISKAIPAAENPVCAENRPEVELRGETADDGSLESMLTSRTKALQDVRRQLEAFRMAHFERALCKQNEQS